MKRALNIVIFVVLMNGMLSACATTTKVDNLGSTSEAKQENCEIEFYNDSEPTSPYEPIGKIESHIEKNFFFGGTVQLEDEAYKELRKKACSLGGDAVIIDDAIESSSGETTRVYVWATVIKFTSSTP